MDQIVVGSLGLQARHGTLRARFIAATFTRDARLLEGWLVHSVGVEARCLTPTGAALVTPPSQFRGRCQLGELFTGYGAGSREEGPRPNLVRVAVVESVTTPDQESVVELTANIDDMSPEQLSYVLQQALQAGALDAWMCPVMMKKGRAGRVIHLLVSRGRGRRLSRHFYSVSRRRSGFVGRMSREGTSNVASCLWRLPWGPCVSR